ncbi:MAG: hypothetical protein IH597_17015 [Bacteroidales bacterium]|nr:hypothetical protein [Bacteroidales bacterium]
MNIESFVIVFYIALYAAAFARFRYALFLYVFFLPIRSLIETPILNILSFNVVFGFIFLFHAIKNGYIKKIKAPSSKTIRALTSFLFVFFLVTVAIAIRERYILHEYLGQNFSVGWVINRFLIFIVTVLNFIVIIKFLLQVQYNRAIVYRAIISSALVIVLSVYFASWIDSIGINIREPLDENIASYNDIMRFSGLYNGGDVNSLSTFLNLVIAFVLTNSVISRKGLSYISLAILVVLISGVIYTLSRMGFITLLIIMTYYILVLNTQVNKFSIRTVANLFIVAMVLFMAFFAVDYYGRLDTIIARLVEQGVTEEIGVGGHRFYRWSGFIEFTFENINRTLFGTNKIFYVMRTGIWTDPHNFFIKLFFLNGIIILGLFIRSAISLYRSFKRQHLTVIFLLFSIIILISMMIISQVGFVSMLILYLGILVYDTNQNSNSYSATKHPSKIR